MGYVKWGWVLVSGTLSACGGRYGDGSDTGAGGGSGSASSATGSTSTTAGSATSTGAGGSGSPPFVDECVMKSMKACGQAVCHNATQVAPAGLNLTYTALTTNYKALYYNQPNRGVGDPDPMYCQAGSFKLIDSANPTASLIYRKILTQEERNVMKAPCGEPMPAIGMVSAADKACVLKWINSVIAASQAQR